MNSNIRTRRKWNRVVLLLVSCYFVNYSISSPIFSSQFSQFQSARNLRNLPCRVKLSGLEGVCMFAIDCIKSNGTHLGTCIDKFYFGSCCQMKEDVDSIYNPEISDNSIDSSSSSNSMSSKPFVPVSSTTISVSSVHSRTTPSTASKPSLSYNNKTFELIPTTKAPQHLAEASTKKFTVSVGGFTTTLGTILEKNFTQSITLPTSTENSRISTFQTILSDEKSTTTRKPPSTSFNRTKKPPAKPTAAATARPSKKPVPQLQSLNRTSVASASTSAAAAPSSITTASPSSSSSTVKVTKRPLTTVRPTKNATSTVIKTTRKPVASTNVTVNRRTTLSSRRNSTSSTTRRPSTTKTTTTTAVPSTIVTNAPPRVTTSAEPPTTTTLFPRPRPTPAEHIVKIETPTLSAEDLIVELDLQPVEVIPTRKPTTTTTTAKSTTVTRRTTKRPQTAAPSSTFSTSTKPSTENPTTFSSDKKAEDATSSTEKVITTTTQQQITSTSGPELVTWTLGNMIVNNSTSKGDEWVLISSVAPSDAKPFTSPTSTTTATVSPAESKITEMPAHSNLTQLTESTTATVAMVTSAEDATTIVTEKVRETTSTVAAIVELEGEDEESEEETENSEENEEDAAIIITTSSSEEVEESPVSSLQPIEDIVKNSTELSENEIAVPATELTDTSSTSSTAAPPISFVSSTNAPVEEVEEEVDEEGGEEVEGEEEEEEEEETIAPQIAPESTTPSTTTSTSTEAPQVELSPDETRPAMVDPSDTTMWPVTEQNNYTSAEANESPSSMYTTESGDEAAAAGLNETATAKYPSSTASSLEGLDYKQICGRRMFPEARIVGGARAAFGRWPWQISLRQWRTSTYLHKCGSALLNENWAISAAHCVDNVPPSDLLLRMGEFDLSIEEEPYGYQERRVQIAASHPQFDPRTFEYDLALLRFYEPVVFQPNIIPVCVPEKDEDFIGRTAFVTGWGRLYEDGPLPSTLQEVTVPVIRNDICESMYRNAGYIEHIPHIFICAGHKQGAKDSCEGDSGGPMVIQREDKRFQLAGIISWGIGCAEPNQPGVYTRISEFRDWINQILMF